MTFPSVEQLQSQQAQAPETQNSSPETNSEAQRAQSNNPEDAAAQALQELDKLERFKFEGQEWTPKDLKAAILRQKDFTQKTQALAEERKSFDSDTKFYRNLSFDLQAVIENPSLAGKFLQTYPEKFHTFLKEAFESVDKVKAARANTQATSQQQTSSRPDIELMMRLEKMEGFIRNQEVAKNETFIDAQIDTLSKKYPDAIPEMVIAKMNDKQVRGENISDPKVWEEEFAAQDKIMNQRFEKKYGDKVKSQLEANKKAQDVDAGGGTPSQAPRKVKSFKEATDLAVQEFTRR